MTIYVAEKDGLRMNIQCRMIKTYHELGYTIYKLEEVEVTDFDAELEKDESSGSFNVTN